MNMVAEITRGYSPGPMPRFGVGSSAVNSHTATLIAISPIPVQKSTRFVSFMSKSFSFQLLLIDYWMLLQKSGATWEYKILILVAKATFTNDPLIASIIGCH